jgi:hypothetical protein
VFFGQFCGVEKTFTDWEKCTDIFPNYRNQKLVATFSPQTMTQFREEINQHEAALLSALNAIVPTEQSMSVTILSKWNGRGIVRTGYWIALSIQSASISDATLQEIKRVIDATFGEGYWTKDFERYPPLAGSTMLTFRLMKSEHAPFYDTAKPDHTRQHESEVKSTHTQYRTLEKSLSTGF